MNVHFRGLSMATEIHKVLIGTIKPDKCSVYLIDGQEVRDTYTSDFCLGGNHFKWPWIPEDEIWVELTRDIAKTVTHEIVERLNMKYLHMTYEKAHSIALSVEDTLREIHKLGEGK
jgi:hypothetical protein